jgi:inorganic triphosphatase YgiF
MSMYDDEIWSKYKLKPVKSTELDALMKTLQEQKKAYESAKGVGEKMKLRIDFEKTRMDIREWYTAKGQELGLDKDAANNFALDIIMKNSI